MKDCESKFLIIQNDTDKHHCKEHLFKLMENLKIYPKYGLQNTLNFYFWIYHAFGSHNSVEDIHILQFIIYIYNKIKHFNIQEIDYKLCIAINELWAQIYWLKYKSTINDSSK